VSNSSLGGSRLPCDIEGPRCTRTSAVDVRDGVAAGVEAAEAGVAGVESKLQTAMRVRDPRLPIPRFRQSPHWSSMMLQLSREHFLLVPRPGGGQIAEVRRARMASGLCQALGIISLEMYGRCQELEQRWAVAA
jgi:hypothetical protein